MNGNEKKLQNYKSPEVNRADVLICDDSLAEVVQPSTSINNNDVNKKQQSVNRPNLKSELGLEDLLSWWRSPLLDCLNGIVGHLVPLFKFPC